MDRKVFFSFHYQDVIDFRANVVRNHSTTKDKNAGYFDESIWEDAKKTSSLALKKLINSELVGTSITCVLIGTETYLRPWVRYEIFRSIYKGNNILGVHINQIKGKDGKTKSSGLNPFDYLGVHFNDDGSKFSFVTRDNSLSSWKTWKEIDSSEFHNNNYFSKEYAGRTMKLSEFFMVYDWINDNGYDNFSNWLN